MKIEQDVSNLIEDVVNGRITLDMYNVRIEVLLESEDCENMFIKMAQYKEVILERILYDLYPRLYR